MLIIDSCCFINNRAIGNALVNVYAEDLSQTSSLNNFGADNSVEYLSTTGLECEFIALVDPNTEFFPSTACIDFDADECAIAGGVTPTMAPTAVSVPTSGPTSVTLAPIMSSEDMPTILSGSEDMPNVDMHAPNHSPTQGPTPLPDESPTVVNSPTSPAQGPTPLPVESPTLVSPTSPTQGPTPLPVDSPTLVYSPALTPSQITPSMIAFTPSFNSPSFSKPSIVASPVQASSPSGSSPPVDEAIGQSVSRP